MHKCSTRWIMAREITTSMTPSRAKASNSSTSPRTLPLRSLIGWTNTGGSPTAQRESSSSPILLKPLMASHLAIISLSPLCRATAQISTKPPRTSVVAVAALLR